MGNVFLESIITRLHIFIHKIVKCNRKNSKVAPKSSKEKQEI